MLIAKQSIEIQSIIFHFQQVVDAFVCQKRQLNGSLDLTLTGNLLVALGREQANVSNLITPKDDLLYGMDREHSQVLNEICYFSQKGLGRQIQPFGLPVRNSFSLKHVSHFFAIEVSDH